VRRQDPERVTKDVGRRIAELRADLGFTQEQLAERLGMDTNNLQRIELGRQNLTIRTLARLATHLDVRVRDLFDPPRSRVVRKGRPPSRGTARPG
jgi:transcriptional regulator with XRE-family HTH domain